MGPHPDLDLLALHALGEPVLDPGSRDHVAGCGSCATTVDELSHTVRTVRGPHEATRTPVDQAGQAGDRVVAVPAHVWQGIAAELDLDPSVRPASVGPSIVTSLRGDQPDDARTPVDPSTAPVDPSTLTGGMPSRAAHREEPRPPTSEAPAERAPEDLGPRRSDGRPVRHRGLRRAGPLLAVAAAGAAVGVAGSAVVTSLGGDDRPQEPTVLAVADLEAFGLGEGTSVTGSARLAVLPPDGGVDTGTSTEDLVLQVWLDDVPDPGTDGFLEAWLIDPVTGSMVSLGPVDAGGDAAVTVDLYVPRGLDVDTYALVDVSAEPLDGDPTHSGDSLVRGTLGA